MKRRVRSRAEAADHEVKKAEARARRKKKAPLEEHEQMRFVEFVRGLKRDDFLVFHVPNEETGRSYARWSWMRAMGVEPGIPDIFLLTPNCRFAFEFKRRGEIASPKQSRILGQLEALGFVCRVVYQAEEAVELVGKLV